VLGKDALGTLSTPSAIIEGEYFPLKMDQSLKELLEATLQNYLKFVQAHNSTLLKLNSYYCAKALSTVLVSDVSRSRDYIVVPSTRLASRPKGNQYLPSTFNIKPAEHEDLRFLPYEEATGQVFKPASLDQTYLRTPFDEYQHSSEIIENRLLADYIALSLLLFMPDFSVKQVAKLLDKTASVIQELKQGAKRFYMGSGGFEVTDAKGLEGKFCRICKTVGCFLHFPSTTKAVLTDTFYDRSERKGERSWDVVRQVDPEGWKNQWFQRNHSVSTSGSWLAAHQCSVKDQCCRHQEFFTVYVPEASEKWITKVMLRKGVMNPCLIAELSGMTCEQAGSVVQSLLKELRSDPPLSPPSDRFFPPTDDADHPFILHHISEPSTCHCTDCSPDSCLCFEGKGGDDQPRNCCEKYCECPPKCTRRFLGCNCKYGGCVTSQCVCWANNRECDPDVCISCIACASDKVVEMARSRKTSVMCRNTEVQRFRCKKTAIAASTITGAGYGLYALEEIRKDEYVSSYTGELISDSEAERRGTLYDSKEHSYIFSLTPEQSLDATILGNKLRYANHRAKGEENCYARNVRVQGNTVVILLAKRDIKYGEELFFDYGYSPDKVKYAWFVQYMEDLEKKAKRGRK